ncbi:dATP/dGTP pyrophosphohydrolase domain-containing protein [Bradyrhizobium sp. 153]|uniref:dATP/dGTP pyrophosphohydrolase domain-containing protein n=1 Tax=Bradyrhizobium sp. 153 TaxID=2782627 RepID=UPI001FF96DAE|nr:DUF550 domain-containing protein [Bradyrhizobium sp. 153]
MSDLIVHHHLHRQRDWSERTFGPYSRPLRTEGVLDHIKKEVREIEAKPSDLEEWVDLIILGCEGALSQGHSPEAIARAWEAKQTKNEGRVWPDWRTTEPGKAIEHDRTQDDCPTACAARDGGPCFFPECA